MEKIKRQIQHAWKNLGTCFQIISVLTGIMMIIIFMLGILFVPVLPKAHNNDDGSIASRLLRVALEPVYAQKDEADIALYEAKIKSLRQAFTKVQQDEKNYLIVGADGVDELQTPKVETTSGDRPIAEIGVSRVSGFSDVVVKKENGTFVVYEKNMELARVDTGDKSILVISNNICSGPVQPASIGFIFTSVNGTECYYPTEVVSGIQAWIVSYEFGPDKNNDGKGDFREKGSLVLTLR